MMDHDSTKVLTSGATTTDTVPVSIWMIGLAT